MALCNNQDFRKYTIQYLTVFVATLGIVSDGMQFGWTSPGIPKLLSNETTLVVTKAETKWITQCYIAGNIIGVLLSFAIFNKLSRKLSIFISCIPILIGWLGNLVATNIWILYVARFIGGIGRNMVYVAVPMYIGEIADPKIRGTLGSFIYMMMNLGVLLVYSITPFLPLYVSATTGLVIALTHIVLLKFVPESPYYLLVKHDEDGARKSLQTLRRTKDVDEELQQLTKAMERQTTGGVSFKDSLKQLFTVPSNLKALCILLMLRAVQMMSGVSVMTMHIHTIFAQAGGNLSSELSAIIYAIMQLCSCFCSVITADRFGRKSLMIFSCFVTSMVLISQGAFYYIKMRTDYNLAPVLWLPIFNIVAFVFSYRVGLGTVPIVMVSELFPANVKVSGVVLSDLMYSISSFLSNLLFHYTEDSLGMFTPFWVYGSLTLIAAVFSYLFVPETKGKTLEEIQQILMKKKVPREKPQKSVVC